MPFVNTDNESFFFFQKSQTFVPKGLLGRALNPAEAAGFKKMNAVLAIPATAPTTPRAIPAAAPGVMV